MRLLTLTEEKTAFGFQLHRHAVFKIEKTKGLSLGQQLRDPIVI